MHRLFNHRTGLVVLILAFWPSPSKAVEFKPISCPDTSLGEMTEDCPWAGIAHALSLVASQGGKVDFQSTVKIAAPEIYNQIVRDGRQTELKAFWGESINFDEFAKAIIIDPAILKALAKTFRIELSDSMMSQNLSHAGMEHTYGYLFSTLRTAFGYKRARWVHGDTERGFGLPNGVLGPDAPTKAGGTLFSNATSFFGRIAFRTEPAQLKALQKEDARASKFIREFDYSKLKPVRLEEVISQKNTVLRTDLIPFLNPSPSNTPGANTHLLIYSIISNGSAKLITGFPVGQAFVENTLSAEGLGEGKQIVTRYNGFIEGVTGKTFTGLRRIQRADTP